MREKGNKKATAIVKPTRRADAPLATRKSRIERAHERLERVLNFDNCPKDYESLKLEAKYLAGLSSYSFAVMAQRLVKIRDGRLFEAEGHTDFQSFIESELALAKSTVYGYIDVYVTFADLAARGGPMPAYSKLLPTLPVIRGAKESERERLKRQLWRVASKKSRKEIEAHVAALKARHRQAPSKPREKSFPARVRAFIGEIPTRPTRADLAALEELKKLIEALQK